MVAKLIALVLCLALIMPINVPAAVADVPVGVTYAAKSHHHKHHDNGKHKGYHKGRHNPHGNGGHHPGRSGQHNPHYNPPQHHSPSPQQHNRPAPQPASPAPQNPGPGTVHKSRTPKTHVASPTVKPEKPKCKVIVKPTEKTVVIKEVPRTKTTVEKVFYGAGVLTAVATGVAVLMLLIGFGVGWYRRKQNEQRFLDEVLNKEE